MTEPIRVGDALKGWEERIARVRAAQRAAGRVPPPTLVKCRTCDDTGFETLSLEGRGTVRQCPSGCKPPQRKSAFDSPPARQSGRGSF